MNEIVNDIQTVFESEQNKLVFVSREQDVLPTVKQLLKNDEAFAVTDTNVYSLHPQIVLNKNAVIPAGEDSKTISVIEELCLKMLKAGLTRSGTAVALGGGVIGDLTGFAASIYMRGINFINVPTTLLSMVDSAIGGKTGVNLYGYKNMIGSFKMPSYIVICPELLKTLPEREWRCGMGELIKTAALCPELYEFVKNNVKALNARKSDCVEYAVKAAASFKKQVTDDDPTEKGRRKILNLGHTVGHAIEKCDNHKLSHGEYVMLGTVIELEMTNSDAKTADELYDMLKNSGLPALPDISCKDITEAAKSDKKNGAGSISVLGVLKPGELNVNKYSPEEFCNLYDSAVKNLIAKGELKNVGN